MFDRAIPVVLRPMDGPNAKDVGAGITTTMQLQLVVSLCHPAAGGGILESSLAGQSFSSVHGGGDGCGDGGRGGGKATRLEAVRAVLLSPEDAFFHYRHVTDLEMCVAWTCYS